MREKNYGLLALLLTICVLCLCGCGGELPGQNLTVIALSPSPECSPVLAPALADGWYGYWYMQETSGDWEHMEGYWWDCCGQISKNGGKYTLLLWDEDMPKERYLALMELELGEDGCYCTGGDFLDAGIKAGMVSAAMKENGALLNISGTYDEPEYGRFEYSMVLRPWGDVWPEDERRPYYYESWYLPRIEAGEAVPDVLDVK